MLPICQNLIKVNPPVQPRAIHSNQSVYQPMFDLSKDLKPPAADNLVNLNCHLIIILFMINNILCINKLNFKV